MTITEETRYHLHQRLEAVLGTEEATTLMAHLPPVGWADVATKRDLDQHGLLAKRDLDLAVEQLRLETVELRADLTREIAHVRVELKQDIADVRVELKQDIADVRGELKQDIAGTCEAS